MSLKFKSTYPAPPVNSLSPSNPSAELIENTRTANTPGPKQRISALRNSWPDFERMSALLLHAGRRLRGRVNRAKFCVENYDCAPAGKGLPEVLVTASLRLHMTDRASNAEKVNAATSRRHQGISQEAWWALFLARTGL